ncbi:hypothetical protein Z043_112164 [Scleropages formosus]|uniref:LysM domain-containing protein n=1 Tax=Scleropages formosus TaxID=113540 RepID=A0A0P7YMP4_SCLFO|nr:hypothetical protein Z043_112164 [Scleropages formosus]
MDYILSWTGKGARSIRDAVSSRVWPAPAREVHFEDSCADSESVSPRGRSATHPGTGQAAERVEAVESRDTLNSIALKFDTTPNELVQLNKLFSRAVVPGQVSRILVFLPCFHQEPEPRKQTDLMVLYVPDPEYASSVGSSPSLSPISPLSPTSSEADLEKVTVFTLHHHATPS